jgi:threonine dehydratase
VSFRDAATLLSTYIRPSRLIASAAAPADLFLKLESELPTGSFKVRGAMYALAVNLQRRRDAAFREVVASSTGNHGAAVAYAANRHGIPAAIFLPRNPNPVKAAKIASFGARIVEGAGDFAAARVAAAEYAERTGAYLMDDATDQDIPIGAGTMALEILAEMPDVGTIVVPVGDSALIRSVAAAAKEQKPGVRIIGVQAERAPSYYLSWQKGSVVVTDTADTIADGLATRVPVASNVAAVRRLVDEMVLVTEDAMLRAMHTLLFEDHIVAEPSGAAALAAYLGLERRPSGKTVLIVTGGNVPPEILRRAIASD